MEGKGSTEYRDTWRGLRILVPEDWQVTRAGPGLLLHDQVGQRAIVVQPRPGALSPDNLRQDLVAWLKRCDPQAEVREEPNGSPEMRLCTVCARTSPGQESIGVFALQMRPAGGLISGFLAPVLTYEADSATAVAALATLQSLPMLSRHLWREPGERAATALVPRGWHVESHIERTRPMAMPAVRFEAWADDLTRVTAGVERRSFLPPGLLNGLRSGRGQVTGRGHFVDAAGYAEVHLVPALREQVSDVRIDAIIPRGELVPLAVAGEAAATGLSPMEVLRGEPSGADVVLTFHSRGVPVRQLSRVITMRVPEARSRGLPLWLANIPYTYRAPAERFGEWEPVLEGIGQSFRLDPAWQRKEQARLRPQQKRDPAEGHEPLAAGLLLAEVEQLVCTHTGRPLALHERPFEPWPTVLGPEPTAGERGVMSAVLSLYETPIWEGVQVRA